MQLQNSFVIREYLRPQTLPTTWCGGCGLGIIMSAIVQAVHFHGLKKDDVAMVSGIGCTGRMSGYVDFNTIHTTHGRAPAFATGLKMARPEMTVITVMGDGDAMSIGGNHLIHAMRRNIGMVAVVVNNNVYGLTGGQTSPTTPVGGHTTTSQAGSFERPMNLEALARQAGADKVLVLERTDSLLGTGLVGGIMRNNGRYTATEEMSALGCGQLFEVCDETARHSNIDFPGHKHASLYDVAKIEPAVRRRLLAAGVEMTVQRSFRGALDFK